MITHGPQQLGHTKRFSDDGIFGFKEEFLSGGTHRIPSNEYNLVCQMNTDFLDEIVEFEASHARHLEV